MDLIRRIEKLEGKITEMPDEDQIKEDIIRNEYSDVGDGVKLTKIDLPLIPLYADLATNCAIVYNKIKTTSDNSTALFREVIVNVKTIEENRGRGALSFPYDHPEFSNDPRTKYMNSLLHGEMHLEQMGKSNIHEWVVKPGRLLFVKFCIKYNENLKNKINNIFRERTPSYREDMLAVKIALEMFTEGVCPPDRLWYPLVSYLSQLLVGKVRLQSWNLVLDWNQL